MSIDLDDLVKIQPSAEGEIEAVVKKNPHGRPPAWNEMSVSEYLMREPLRLNTAIPQDLVDRFNADFEATQGNFYRPPPQEPPHKQCGGCHSYNAILRCARCRKVWYCCKECQQVDSKMGGHKKQCDRKVKGKK